MTPEQITERIDELLEFWEQYSTGSQEQHSEEEYKEAAGEWLPILTSMKDGVSKLQSRIDELEEQLRNSIPKPVGRTINLDEYVVTRYDDGDYDVHWRSDGKSVLDPALRKAVINESLHVIEKTALGQEGGGDE